MDPACSRHGLTMGSLNPGITVEFSTKQAIFWTIGIATKKTLLGSLQQLSYLIIAILQHLNIFDSNLYTFVWKITS